MTKDENNNDSGQVVISLENQAVVFLADHITPVILNEISTCHVLPRFNDKSERKNNKNSPKNIIVRFNRRRSKPNILWNARNQNEYNKPASTKVFLNEHLTKNNSEIFRIAWGMKKSIQISNTFTQVAEKS